MKSTYEANRVLDARYGGGAYVKAEPLYVFLCITAPTVAGFGAEPAGGSYARQAVVNDATNFPNAVARAKQNATVVTFPAATAAWGTIGWGGFGDALVAGHMLDWAALTATKTVQIGDVVQFAIGSIAFTES